MSTGLRVAGDFYGDKSLRDCPAYKARPFWEYGYSVCRAIGLLDARNRPTFAWPDWSRIEPHKNAIRKHFYTKAKTPLPALDTVPR